MTSKDAPSIDDEEVTSTAWPTRDCHRRKKVGIGEAKQTLVLIRELVTAAANDTLDTATCGLACVQKSLGCNLGSCAFRIKCDERGTRRFGNVGVIDREVLKELVATQSMLVV